MTPQPRVAKESAALNNAARLSYTTEKCGAQGVQPTAEIMRTTQAQAMVNAYVEAGVSPDKAVKYAGDLLQTGTTLPRGMTIGVDMELIKVVPKGALSGDTILGHSPYFMTREQYNALSNLSAGQLANRLGLPAEQAIRGAQLGFDVYSMKPLPGTMPTVFTSEIAPVQQGAYSASGGRSKCWYRIALSGPIRMPARSAKFVGV